jgi:hypothetical protein
MVNQIGQNRIMTVLVVGTTIIIIIRHHKTLIFSVHDTHRFIKIPAK